jgi:hypothetical protein
MRSTFCVLAVPESPRLLQTTSRLSRKPISVNRISRKPLLHPTVALGPLQAIGENTAMFWYGYFATGQARVYRVHLLATGIS